ncbi:glycosyltransferase [Methanosphaera sp. WGK6]|uniref:glycosyltransferase family 2 protein n=1 Tax=Methanosphaera sp. WGK6 TaxID=1561964 RepID=UPI00084C408A|nr:glycosyltransferase [Methanosphaera sp. WGK6]OED30848.1 hypothetical protein NL43_00610 [Methanosphaera sp. WGK6]
MMSIICVYNNIEILENYLLKSLKKQKGDYELILVDNRKNKFSNAASALNYGASKSKGEYLVFTHQDINFINENWIIDTCHKIKQLDNIGIIGVAGKTTDSLVRSNIKQGLSPVDVSPYKLDKTELASTLDECLFIIPREIFNKYLLDEKQCPDWHLYCVDYVYNIREKGYNAYLIPTELEHRSKGASMSEGYYETLPNLQKKYKKEKLIRTCMGDWFTFIPVNIQRRIKKYKPY